MNTAPREPAATWPGLSRLLATLEHTSSSYPTSSCLNEAVTWNKAPSDLLLATDWLLEWTENNLLWKVNFNVALSLCFERLCTTYIVRSRHYRNTRYCIPFQTWRYIDEKECWKYALDTLWFLQSWTNLIKELELSRTMAGVLFWLFSAECFLLG